MSVVGNEAEALLCWILGEYMRNVSDTIRKEFEISQLLLGEFEMFGKALRETRITC